MPGLLDIARSSQTVTVGETVVPVYGVSAAGIAVILERFPVVREAFTGRSPNITSESLFTLVPEAIACVIAAGTGSPGDRAAEEVAASLPAETQLEFLEHILRLTMPKGVGPFAERLQKTFLQLDLGAASPPNADGPSTNTPVTK